MRRCRSLTANFFASLKAKNPERSFRFYAHRPVVVTFFCIMVIYLLPMILQARFGGEKAGVVNVLQLLEDVHAG